MIRLMLDIETFSRRPDAAIFEVAIVPFYADGRVDPPGSTRQIGHWQWVPSTGHFEGETVAWWMRQGGREGLVTPEGYDELRVVDEIYAYLAGFGEDVELWAQHTSFDCVILQQLLARHGRQMPVGFRRWRDLPTLRAEAGRPAVPRMGQRHLAVDDCLHQIAVWAECRRALGTAGVRPALRTRLASAQEFAEASASLARGAPSRQLPSTPAPECAEIADPGCAEPPVGVDDGEFWKERAAQHMRNEEFYRDLLDQCAVHLGPDVYVQDDGGRSDEPLRLKIPALVKALAARSGRFLDRALRSGVDSAFFEGLLEQCAVYLGPEAYVVEDGSTEAGTLCDFPVWQQIPRLVGDMRLKLLYLESPLHFDEVAHLDSLRGESCWGAQQFDDAVREMRERRK